MADNPGPQVAFTLPDLDVGGGQTILLRSLVALRAAPSGVQPLVVALRGGPMLDDYRSAGVPCHVLGLPRGLAAVAGYPLALVRLLRLCRREGVAALCSLNTPLDRGYAQLAGLALRLPVVVWFMSRAVRLIGFPPPRGRELAFAKRLALWPVNAVSSRLLAAKLSLSREAAASFASHLRLAPSTFTIVPPGLPEPFFRPPLDDAGVAELRRSLGVADAQPLLLCVGMLIPLKGQQVLASMMAELAQRLPRACLLLVGEGELRPALEAQIAEAGLAERVRLLGHRKDVPELLAACDGLVSASSSEGFGMAVLEAMAAGKPVVAVHTPAFEEFATRGVTARFVDRPDARLLADAVAEVFSEPERASAMGEAGRRRAEEFRVERTAERLALVLGDVVASRETTPSTGGRAPESEDPVAREPAAKEREAKEIVVARGPGEGLRLAAGPASADYRSGRNEAAVQAAVAELLSPGDVFYDVGANVGFFSLVAARRVGPGGTVVAFEPVAEMAAAARDNAARNGLAVEVFEVAVADRDGEATLILTDHPGGAALEGSPVPPDARGEVSVRAARLASLVEEEELPIPTVVKVDVEGAEPQALAGMMPLLEAYRPALVVEVDGAPGEETDHRLAEVEWMLHSAGYALRRLPDAYPGNAWRVVHLVATPAD